MAGLGVSRPPDHPPLAAPVSGVAAWWLHSVALRALPTALESFARNGAHPGVLAELQTAVLALAAAAEQWTRWRVAVDGSAELLVAEAGPALPHEITTDAAAALLGVTPRRVRQLAAAGILDARRVGRVWLVDRSSLELLRVVRRSA